MKVPDRLRRQAKELAETASHLARLLESELWLSRTESLIEVEERVTEALAAIRVRVKDQDVERQVLSAIKSFAKATQRDDEPLTEEQATRSAVGLVTDVVGELRPGTRVDPEHVRQAIQAHLRPAKRGRPKRDDRRVSKKAAVAKLLKGLGLLEAGDHEEAARKRLARRDRK